MPGADVQLPWPLIRQNPWFPGQLSGPYGVANETGLRQHCTGTVFYVDPNYPGVVNRRHGTDPNWPLQTVEMALSLCQSYRGDVILVMANDDWTWGQGAEYNLPIQEAVTVTVHGVSIIGVSRSGALGVCWTPPATGGPMITVHAMDCLIEGFCFMGGLVGGTAIDAEYGLGMYGENLTVRNCFFDPNVDIGIQGEFTWNCHIHNNIFQECDAYGIYVDPEGSGIADCRIHHNWFQNCGAALSLNGAQDCEIFENTVYNSDAQAGIAATDLGIDTTAGRCNIVHHNTLSCILPVAAPGDWDDFCSSSPTDAYISNHLLNGDSITNPT